MAVYLFFTPFSYENRHFFGKKFVWINIFLHLCPLKVFFFADEQLIYTLSTLEDIADN